MRFWNGCSTACGKRPWPRARRGIRTRQEVETSETEEKRTMRERKNNTTYYPRGRNLAERVEARVQHLMSGRVRDFHVVIQERGLVLHGRTRTYHPNHLARKPAMEAA